MLVKASEGFKMSVQHQPSHADQRDQHQSRIWISGTIFHVLWLPTHQNVLMRSDTTVAGVRDPRPVHNISSRQSKIQPYRQRLLLWWRDQFWVSSAWNVQVGCLFIHQHHACYACYACRYIIGNCLFEAAYQEVLNTCGCTPYFHWGNVQLDFILQKRPFCKVSSRVKLVT